MLLCLVGTGFLLAWRPVSEDQARSVELSQVLDRIGDWQKVAEVPFDPIIIEELKLDDFLFQSYARQGASVELYIGYYYSADKVGAAHDPLVCFPGQGWQISGKGSDRLTLPGAEAGSISYSRIIAEKDEEQTLVLYWFQAGEETAAGTFMQKLHILKNKLRNHNVNNAFVRVSVPLKEISQEEGEERVHQFIADFYPVFRNYLTSG